MLLEQILRRQAAYTQSLHPRSSVALVESAPKRPIVSIAPKAKPSLVSAPQAPRKPIAKKAPRPVEEAIELVSVAPSLAEVVIEQIVDEFVEENIELVSTPLLALAEFAEDTDDTVEDIIDYAVALAAEHIEIIPELPPRVEAPIEVAAPALTDSGVFAVDTQTTTTKPFDLVAIFEKYAPKTRGKAMGAKTMGLPVPEDLHARMLKFLADNKNTPGSPQSLRDLGLMCIGLAMDSIEDQLERAKPIL